MALIRHLDKPNDKNGITPQQPSNGKVTCYLYILNFTTTATMTTPVIAEILNDLMAINNLMAQE